MYEDKMKKIIKCLCLLTLITLYAYETRAAAAAVFDEDLVDVSIASHPLRQAHLTLLYASRDGKEDVVIAELAAGKDPNLTQCCDGSRTAVWYAADRGHTDILRRLLAAGGNPRTRDIAKTSPLLAASRNGHEGAVALLVSHDARVDVPDCSNETPILAAYRREKFDVVGILIGAGARLSEKNYSFGSDEKQARYDELVSIQEKWDRRRLLTMWHRTI